MARKPKTPKTTKNPKSTNPVPTSIDLFADTTTATTTTKPRKRGRPSNLEKAKMAEEAKKAEKVTYPGTNPAKYNNLDNIINRS